MITKPLFPELINILRNGGYRRKNREIKLGKVQGAEIFHNLGDSSYLNQLTFLHQLLGKPEYQTFGFQQAGGKVIQINGVCAYDGAASMAVLTDIPGAPFSAKGFLSFENGTLEYRYGHEQYLILYPQEGESFEVPINSSDEIDSEVFSQNYDISDSTAWAQAVWENP